MRNDIANHSNTSIASRLRHRLALVVAVPLLIAGLAACQSNTGLSEEDATAIKDQIEQVASRLDAVEERLIDLSRTSSDAPALLISEVRAATTDVGEAKNILADVTSQLEVSVPDENVAPLDDVNDPLPGVDDTLQDLGNDVQNGLDNAGDAIEDSIDDVRDNVNDGLDDARDTLDPAPNAPLPDNDLVPDERDPAPLGN